MKHTVVIADDDPDIRELIGIAVRRSGLHLLAAVTNGTAALAAIRDFHPDLAILDIAMPEMSGIEVCTAVRADPSIGDVRILLLSASVDDASRAVGIAAGANYFLAKPFSPKELTAWLAVGKEELA